MNDAAPVHGKRCSGASNSTTRDETIDRRQPPDDAGVQHCARSLLRHLAQGRDSDVDVDQASPDGTGPTGRVPSRPATGAAERAGPAVTGSDRQL